MRPLLLPHRLRDRGSAGRTYLPSGRKNHCYRAPRQGGDRLLEDRSVSILLQASEETVAT